MWSCETLLIDINSDINNVKSVIHLRKWVRG